MSDAELASVLDKVADRFWSHVDRSAGPNSCWPWTAAINREGYGVFHPDKSKTERTHRFALSLHLGRPIRSDAFVLHSCDHRPCCNPAHLREGTHLDNMRDAVSRGRQKRGVGDPNAKLTDQSVLEIRLRASRGERLVDLASEFAVCQATVTGVVRGDRWTHVGGPLTFKYRTNRKAS